MSLLMVACSPGSPESSGKYDLERSAKQLSDNKYKNLSALQQYQVSNKLMSALFKGIPANEFFRRDSIGMDPADLQVSIDYLNFVAQARGKLRRKVKNPDEIYTKIMGDSNLEIEAKYDIRSEPMEFPLAHLYELPLSQDFFSRWIAYKLANTIMFAPAEEIDSADENDVQTIYESLALSVQGNASIRSIILAHQKSPANWRRFRSPEDNTREMIEIYLGLFDRDADVPKASKACQNWKLTDEDEGYELRKSANINTEPQLILDSYWVTTCDDFYEVVANHPLVIPRVTTVLIDHMFGVDYDTETRAALAVDIASSEPETFTDIFLAILFSEEFLLNMERPKWFEESFFNAADRVHWNPYGRFFRDVAGYSTNSMNLGMNMPLAYQPSFSLKLGRWPSVPQDVLSVSYIHKGLRNVFMRYGGDFGWGWSSEFAVGISELSHEELINYVFLSILGRTPSEDELTTLAAFIDSAYQASDVNKMPWLGTDSRTDERTMLIMDYISRLPELYFFTPVSVAG